MSNKFKWLGAVCLAALALYSCGGKKVGNVSSEPTESTSVTTSVQTGTSTKTTSSAPKKTSSAATSVTTTTAAAEMTDEEAAAETTAAPAPTNGYSSAVEAAQTYYNAYLSDNFELVYDMFSQEEIDGYHRLVDRTGMLGEETAENAFRKAEVVKAIKLSMAGIREVMAANSTLPPEQWTVTFKPDDLTANTIDELSNFNVTLGTGFSTAMDCAHVYYTDGQDEHKFVGNGCAFVEKDGKWYLSYSTYMNSELLTYMDIF